MKNILKIFGYTLLSAAFLAGLSACQEEAVPQVIAITATAPADNASADLADGNIRFAWQASGSVPGGFELVLSPDAGESSSRIYKLPSTVFSREIKAVDMDLLMKNWGKPVNETSPVMWTVRPAVEGEAEAAQWYTLNVKRLEVDTEEIYLRTPSDNVFCDLGESSDVVFTWDNSSSIASCRIDFSTTEDGPAIEPEGVELEVSGAKTLTLSSEDLMKIFQASGVTEDIALLYWKVHSTDITTPGVSESRRIRLMKIGASGVSPVANLKVVPGYERFVLTADIIDPRTAKVSVAYGDHTEEVTVAEGQESLTFEKTSVAENVYTVSVTSYNAENESSTVAECENVSVYGTTYQSGKSGRQLTCSALTTETAEFVVTKIEDSDLKYSELVYTLGGEKMVLRVENDAESISLPSDGVDKGQTLTLKSYYAPSTGGEVLDIVAAADEKTIYLPEYGILVPLDKIKHYPNNNNTGALPGEMSTWNDSFPYSMLFDAITDNHLNMWHTPNSEEKVSEEHPIIVTIDLGTEYCLSSYRVWGRNPWYDKGNGVLGDDSGAYWAFGNFNPRKFKLYGSAEDPQNTSDESYWAVNGGWIEDWTLLADSEVIRPSGVDDPKVRPTDEDIAAAEAGAEFPVNELSDSPVRYVRLVITETWNPDQLYRISFGELHFFYYTPQE